MMIIRLPKIDLRTDFEKHMTDRLSKHTPNTLLNDCFKYIYNEDMMRELLKKRFNDDHG